MLSNLFRGTLDFHKVEAHVLDRVGFCKLTCHYCLKLFKFFSVASDECDYCLLCLLGHFCFATLLDGFTLRHYLVYLSLQAFVSYFLSFLYHICNLNY